MSNAVQPPSHLVHMAGVFLRLGRVSNLPTVWTNVLAGAILAGAGSIGWPLLALMLAISAFYVGGMYLNDAFDRAIDARERPTRPIPAGDVRAATVFGIGFALMACGLLLLAPYGGAALLSGCALGATIVLYDCWHKANPASPLIMGLCRALVYVTAAVAVTSTLDKTTMSVIGDMSDMSAMSDMTFLATAKDLAGPGGRAIFNQALALGALAVFAHVVGLTYAAKQESLDRLERLWPLAVLALPALIHGAPILAGLANPANLSNLSGLAVLLALIAANMVAVRLLAARAVRGDVPKAVAQLIAATSLVDAAAIMAVGGPLWALLACVCAYFATRLLQRVIPGT